MKEFIIAIVVALLLFLINIIAKKDFGLVITIFTLIIIGICLMSIYIKPKQTASDEIKKFHRDLNIIIDNI